MGEVRKAGGSCLVSKVRSSPRAEMARAWQAASYTAAVGAGGACGDAMDGGGRAGSHARGGSCMRWWGRGGADEDVALGVASNANETRLFAGVKPGRVPRHGRMEARKQSCDKRLTGGWWDLKLGRAWRISECVWKY